MSATEELMRDSEAREWVERVRREGHNRASGDRRLEQILSDIAKRRGRPAANDLKARIEKELGRALG